MRFSKHGRHTSSFILLILVYGPKYGLSILETLKDEMPMCSLDSAGVYRTLKKLEISEAVESYWDTSEPGAAKKWYKITPVGRDLLSQSKKDIEMRIKNLQYFLNKFEKIPENAK